MIQPPIMWRTQIYDGNDSEEAESISPSRKLFWYIFLYWVLPAFLLICGILVIAPNAYFHLGMFLIVLSIGWFIYSIYVTIKTSL